MSAELNHAVGNARRELRLSLLAAVNRVDWLRDTYVGSIEQSWRCDEIVGHLEETLRLARQLETLAHANAAAHHEQAGRPGLREALARFV